MLEQICELHMDIYSVCVWGEQTGHRTWRLVETGTNRNAGRGPITFVGGSWKIVFLCDRTIVTANANSRRFSSELSYLNLFANGRLVAPIIAKRVRAL
jgi:hypothetical protein